MAWHKVTMKWNNLSSLAKPFAAWLCPANSFLMYCPAINFRPLFTLRASLYHLSNFPSPSPFWMVKAPHKKKICKTTSFSLSNLSLKQNTSGESAVCFFESQHRKCSPRDCQGWGLRGSTLLQHPHLGLFRSAKARVANLPSWRTDNSDAVAGTSTGCKTCLRNWVLVFAPQVGLPVLSSILLLPHCTAN